MSANINWAIDIDCRRLTHDTGTTVLYERWCQEPRMQQGGETEDLAIYAASLSVDHPSEQSESMMSSQRQSIKPPFWFCPSNPPVGTTGISSIM
jgi:hypothetical protein